MTRRTPEPPCPNQARHTEVIGMAAAALKWRTHEQTQCPDCGFWVIWTPLPEGSLVVCWRCLQRNVDPTALPEFAEPLCTHCLATVAADREARWAAEAAALDAALREAT